MSDQLKAQMKAAGFKFAITVAKDVSGVVVGAPIAFFKIWARSEQEFLDRINKTYAGVVADAFIKEEL